jgi:hypothetical protein
MKTAVEWLIEQWPILESQIPERILEQAKEIEKEQMFGYIKKNYVNGENSLKFHTEEFENYYNETFKSE